MLVPLLAARWNRLGPSRSWPVVLAGSLLVILGGCTNPNVGTGEGSAPSAARFGVHMDLGFQDDAGRRRQSVRAARDLLQAQISRNSLLWHQIEPVPGSRDFRRADAFIKELRAAEIEPLLVVYGSPSWANGVPETVDDHYLYVPGEEAVFDRWLDRYAEFLRAAAARYRGQVIKWELWNEPNEHFFWKPRPSPQQYARFFRRMRDAILAGNPEAEIALGGLAGISATGRGDIRGVDFLRRLLQFGVRPQVVAVHPYPGKGQPPDVHLVGENNFDDIARIRAELVRRDHPVRLWVTEWGWPTDHVDPNLQASYIARSLELIVTRYPYVTVATVFIDHDRPPRFFHGLLDADLHPKPAARAFARFVHGRAAAASPTQPPGP
jgi:polysaccharide biosynthesis protein PslG